jgi:hypothetical protein
MNLAEVNALAVLPNGDVIEAGRFAAVGGVTANNIARWSAASNALSPLGTGLSGTAGAYVAALAVMPNGDVVAGGRFTTAGGVAANYIAKWNGSAWAPLGAGMDGASGVVESLIVMPNGDLIAGGDFTNAGAGPASHIARWNGTQWSSLGAGMDFSVYAMAVLPNGTLVAGGGSIAQWNGTQWSSLGTGATGIIYALKILPDGDLIAAGMFYFYIDPPPQIPAYNIARWNGATWARLGNGLHGADEQVFALATLPNGDLVAAGDFALAGTVAARNVARWNGTAWAAMGTGTESIVYALATLHNGDLLAGGPQSANGSYVVRWSTRATCPADFDCSGGVGVQDIFDFLNAWLSLDPRADFNGVGGVTTQDIFDFLNAWFAGCP